ncbi:hypothetical protein CEUSTIGMA_g10232.t1 [Chlamydomonas eustigma]|uniref:Plastid lipid-associated protein/fibrillin conserved domain-containing protein n=1 Tax=Chlamydomonas eustigma TaxID=1157962 RepID=A0A250XIH0_9CHLO|nr:hypothetical protein CEUSTIGMA_g10232.t1 [Chlamydomonas eustigma]|eukprot:GAX82806.1 hypothetical protein CEUSTIGMA_g10232.t1 [Chlamydomonas eustigma]
MLPKAKGCNILFTLLLFSSYLIRMQQYLRRMPGSSGFSPVKICNSEFSSEKQSSADAMTEKSLSLETVKSNVRKAVSGTDRGKKTSVSQRQDVLEKIINLENLNELRNPAKSELLSGMWTLLYQAPLSEEKAAKDISGTTEGPFLAFFQPLTRGLVKTKGNLQLIDIPNNRVENLAEFTIAGSLDGYLNIAGVANVMEPTSSIEEFVRISVEFTEFTLSLGSKVQWRVPLSWVKAKGWVETTYLDKEMRVGRGDKGSIFVASRLKGFKWPAER